MMSVAKSLAHMIYRRVFWTSPALHLTYLNARGFKTDFSDVSVVVQGFPRSGNTYLSIALSDFKAFEGRVFSHIHTPAIFAHAIRHDIPVVMPVRDPMSSLVSLSQLAGWDDRRCIDHYLCYYRYSKPYLKQLAVIEFTSFTQDTPSALSRLSARTGLKFRHADHAQIETQAFGEIDKRSVANAGEIEAHTVHRPNQTRSAQKAEIRERLEQNHGPALLRCEALYQQFLAEAI